MPFKRNLQRYSMAKEAGLGLIKQAKNSKVGGCHKLNAADP